MYVCISVRWLFVCAAILRFVASVSSRLFIGVKKGEWNLILVVMVRIGFKYENIVLYSIIFLSWVLIGSLVRWCLSVVSLFFEFIASSSCKDFSVDAMVFLGGGLMVMDKNLWMFLRFRILICKYSVLSGVCKIFGVVKFVSMVVLVFVLYRWK